MLKKYGIAQAYYDHLLEMELVEEILNYFDEEEKSEALRHLLELLDHAVLEAILQKLEEKHHEELLLQLTNKYHDQGIIDWLEERSEGIIVVIATVLRETKQTIILELGDQTNL